MTSRLDMATPEAFVDCRARQVEATSTPPVIVTSAWCSRMELSWRCTAKSAIARR
jgi:hypothetical protein